MQTHSKINTKKMGRLKTKKWKSIREQCIQRDGGKCRKCGRVAKQVHHIIPYNKGGEDKLKNLVTLCKRCHNIADNLYFKYGLRSQDKIWLKENKQIKETK